MKREANTFLVVFNRPTGPEFLTMSGDFTKNKTWAARFQSQRAADQAKQNVAKALAPNALKETKND